MNHVIAQALGIKGLLVLGMLLVMAVASVDTPARVSAHAGAPAHGVIHSCVHHENGEVRVLNFAKKKTSVIRRTPSLTGISRGLRDPREIRGPPARPKKCGG